MLLRSAGRLAGIALEVVVDVEVLEGFDRIGAPKPCRGEAGFSLAVESSSFDLRSREISTVLGWCQNWPQG